MLGGSRAVHDDLRRQGRRGGRGGEHDGRRSRLRERDGDLEDARGAETEVA
jgi:hypothetical protein